jgi:putative Mg2+ transporter-C (MgtC) family protein
MELTLQEAIQRLVMALLLGSIVGLEREYTQQYAGLRTHILVCLGAAVFTIVSISDMTAGMTVISSDPDMQYRLVKDPGRVAAQVVAGIGFIGGGAVLRHGASIRGLTTAASLWMMASIGMLVGIGYYQLSIVATLFSFLVLFIIGALERTMFKKYMKRFTLLRIQVTARDQSFPDIENLLDKTFPQKTVEVKTQRDLEAQKTTMTYVIDLRGIQPNVNELSRKLKGLDGVLSATVKVYHEEKQD